MTISRRSLLASAAGAAAFGAAGTSLTARAQVATETLKMAFICGLTGGYAVYADELRKGVDLAVEIINFKGLKIGGKNYKIVVQAYDDKTEGSTAARLVERAVTNDGSHAVLASGGSVIVKANLSVAQRLRFPMIPLWSQVDGVYAAQKGDPYLFSGLPPFSFMYRQIMALLGTLDNPKIKSVAMITPNDELGVYTGKEYLPADLKLADMKLAGVEYYPAKTQEYTTALSRVRRLEADCLVVNALSADVIGILKEMNSTGYSPKSVVVESPSGLREPFGDMLNGMYVPIIWDKDIAATRDDYVGTGPDFARLYREKYGKEMPDFVAAIGAHDVITYCKVLAAAGTIDDTQKIRAAFQAFNGETFFGPVGFGDDGLNHKGHTYAGQFQDQVPKIVYPSAAAVAKPINPYPGYKG
jgi:branched-chain amino acid transport system substrate-binding protein